MHRPWFITVSQSIILHHLLIITRKLRLAIMAMAGTVTTTVGDIGAGMTEAEVTEMGVGLMKAADTMKVITGASDLPVFSI
jgi:hypothetical protein